MKELLLGLLIGQIVALLGAVALYILLSFVLWELLPIDSFFTVTYRVLAAGFASAVIASELKDYSVTQK